MSDISEKLLEQAVNSILHGSVQMVQATDQNGNTTYREVRINDLRQELVEKIANKLINTDQFRDILVKAFDYEIIKKLQENALNSISYQNLPWDIQKRIEREMKDLKVEVKKYKLIAEAIEQ